MVSRSIHIAMSRFAADVADVLNGNLLAVILHGSAVLGDFRPGKGDLDFMAVTRHGLTAEDCDRLFTLHDTMRGGGLGELSAQLEGTYYPLPVVEDPRHAEGKGCYIGTGRKGWSQVTSSQNSLSDFAIICRHGIFYGNDIRQEIYHPSDRELIEQFRNMLEDNIRNASTDNRTNYAISMFHWASRGLCHALTGQLLSKGAAARWFANTSPDPHWGALVLHADKYRYPLSESELREIDPSIVQSVREFLEYIRGLLAAGL